MALISKLLEPIVFVFPYLIGFVKNPSFCLQKRVIRQNLLLIRVIDNPHELILLQVVRENATLIAYIKNPSERIQITACKRKPFVIKYIKNPCEEAQLAAVARFKYPEMIEDFIDNPTPLVKKEIFRRKVSK